MLIRGARICLAIAVTLFDKGAPVSTPSALGSGKGLDHVGVVVRDLSQARQDFAGLGFNVSPGGSFPGGLNNCAALFGDGTYIELLSVTEPHPDSALAARVKTFGEEHEGAIFAGFDVSSARDAYAFLKGRQFDVSDPHPSQWFKQGETKPSPPSWFIVNFAAKPAAGTVPFVLPIFFIQYRSDKPTDQKIHDAAIQHPNTALGVHAVWFAVNDAQARLRELKDVGFTESRRTVKLFDVKGPEIKAGNGVLSLLSSEDKRREPARYLGNHDEGIVAASVQVSDLLSAKVKAESALHTQLKTYNGAFGKSFLIPASQAHGLWIEMFER